MEKSKVNLITVIVLVLGAILILFPIGMIVLTSFASNNASIGEVISLKAFTLSNYQEAWARGKFLLAFLNSTIIALSVTGLQLITSALAGYALARLQFKGKQAILLLI